MQQTTSVPYYITFVADSSPVTVTRKYTSQAEYVRRVKNEIESKGTTAEDHSCVLTPAGIEIASSDMLAVLCVRFYC